MKLVRLVYVVRCSILFVRLLLFTVHILHFDQCVKKYNHTTDLICPTPFQYMTLITIYCYDLVVIGLFTTIIIGCSKRLLQFTFIRIGIIIVELGSLSLYFLFVLQDSDHLPLSYRVMFLTVITMLSVRRVMVEALDIGVEISVRHTSDNPMMSDNVRSVAKVIHYFLRYIIMLGMVGIFYQVEFQSKHTNWYAMFAPGLFVMLHVATLCFRLSIREDEKRKFPKFQLELVGAYIFLMSVLLILVVPIWREIEYKNTTRIIELLLTMAFTVDIEEVIQMLAGEAVRWDFEELQ